MDLIYVEGSTKLLLTNQCPLIQAIIQDVIENLRASLLFNNAFPDATITFTLTRDALNAAAESHKPGGALVQQRLQDDGPSSFPW